ncbi:MAG: bifunctional DNA-formamidopyrimidine glycosylase/DNA-(apurinic or apyrimidinic site) lyase [Rhizobiaceae bacterium]|nr:bifunctional DNA-formamidopyrimidine glycosylase/DNA-(apurinic or apyrimidinic site) lyase [Rhizobiaceae bacterium]
MPELPEVETVRRGLQPVMEGALVTRVEQRRPNLRYPFPTGFAEQLTGRTVTAVARRAKYLTFHFDRDPVLISHLGMSGSFRIENGEDAAVPGTFHHERSKDAAHDHAVFHLRTAGGSSARVVFNDPRRFGFMLFSEASALAEHPMLVGLGVEPTGNTLDGSVLNMLLRDKRAPLKAALMDQRLIAGLGNIYVCEALWRSRLSPRRMAGSIASSKRPSTPRTEALAQAIREVIADAIAAGGSSLRDYQHADGSLGYFQHRFAVYDREGEHCPREGCPGTVSRIVQSGRSTFYCGTCQR